MNIHRTVNSSWNGIMHSSSKPIMDECFKINKKRGCTKTLGNKNYLNISHDDKLSVYGSQASVRYNEQEKLSQIQYRQKTCSHGKSFKKCKMCFPKSFPKCDSKTGLLENVTYTNLKTLNFKSKKTTITQKEKIDSYIGKENKSLLLCKRVESHPIKHSTPSLLMKRQVSKNFGELKELPKVNHRSHLQNTPELESHIDFNCKCCCNETRRAKQTDETGNSKNIFLSPKLSNNKSFDRNTRIQYQLANKLMPVSTSEDLVFYRKITVKTHSSEATFKYHQSNIISSCRLLKEISSNIEQPTSCTEIPLYKMPIRIPPIKETYENKMISRRSPKISSSSLSTLGSSESYMSFDEGSSFPPSKIPASILQLLHPHWRRVPHKSYFGWTKNHERLFNELQTKVRECKIPSAYYTSPEEYVGEIRKIKKTNLRILKGPIVVNVNDILDLIHKTHVLSIKNSDSKQTVLYKLDAYDADNDEIDDYCDN